MNNKRVVKDVLNILQKRIEELENKQQLVTSIFDPIVYGLPASTNFWAIILGSVWKVVKWSPSPSMYR